MTGRENAFTIKEKTAIHPIQQCGDAKVTKGGETHGRKTKSQDRAGDEEKHTTEKGWHLLRRDQSIRERTSKREYRAVQKALPYLSGSSIIDIINPLAEEHIPSPQGGTTWSEKTIANILANSKYTSNVEILKTDPGGNGYCMWDVHKAIIFMEDWVDSKRDRVAYKDETVVLDWR